MNRQERLFTNKFIQDIDTRDIPSSRKEEFRRYHEQKIEQQRRKQILLRTANNPPKFNNPSNSQTSNDDIYSELARFKPVQHIPLNLLKPTGENVKIEKKTIVSIDSRDRDLNKYPLQNDFTTFLGKTFFNVKKIELVSTEFPNTDQVIKDKPIELQNNLITWQNEEDIDLNFFTGLTINTTLSDFIDITLDNHGFTVGSTLIVTLYNSKLNSESSVSGIIDGKRQITILDTNTFRFPYIGGLSEQGTTSIDLGHPQYTVEIKPGNYTASTLSEQISTDLGFVKRKNKTGQFHFFNVNVNLDTDLMTLDSVITFQLANNPLSTIAGSTTITVNQNNHGFKTGDRVKMIGVKNTAGIKASTLSGDFIITVLDFNTFTYEVITRASETLDGGGNTVITGKDAPFRLLFDTQNTRIQFNTGFPNENSSDYIGIPNPITTKALNISNVTIISSDKLRFTTPVDHGLQAVNIKTISNIQLDSPNNVIITTSTPHDIDIPSRITLRSTNSIPKINGTFFAFPIGIFAFRLKGLSIITSGNYGELLYGDDKIKIIGLKSVPNILIDPLFFVENVPTPNQFDITFKALSIDTLSIKNTKIGTGQIFIQHPSHNFNQLSSITSLSTTFANLQTFLPHNLIGSRTDNVSITAGPINTNTLNILLPKHGLSTSDQIVIINDTITPDPQVNGTYKVQIVDLDNFRINFVYSTFNSRTVTVLTGDIVTITHTNSLPRINGTYSLHNRLLINTISTGTITSLITTTLPNNWTVGDIITISNTDSTPNIDGIYTILSKNSNNSFEIQTTEPITSPGSSGIVINNNRFEIDVGFQIINPGTNPAGILGRSNDVIHYRIQGENEGSNQIGGINLNILNSKSRTIAKLIDTDNYMIRLTEGYAENTITAGGPNVRISSDSHGLRSIQANTDTGTPKGLLFRSISLEGENYVYLISESEGLELNTVLNTANVSNTFAKILLSESPGNLMFNSFISEPKVFDNPISKIDTVRFKIVTPQGFPFDFNDIDYSFTLRITELVDQLEEAFISSRTGTTEFKNALNKNSDLLSNNLTDESGKNTSLTKAAGPGFAFRSTSREFN